MFERMKTVLPASLSLKSLSLKSLGAVGKVAAVVLGIYLLVVIALGFYWSSEPDPFSVTDNMREKVATAPTIGAATTSALIRAAETMLDKPGGYLSNDITPPDCTLTTSLTGNSACLCRCAISLARSAKISAARNPSPPKTWT